MTGEHVIQFILLMVHREEHVIQSILLPVHREERDFFDNNQKFMLTDFEACSVIFYSKCYGYMDSVKLIVPCATVVLHSLTFYLNCDFSGTIQHWDDKHKFETNRVYWFENQVS